MASFKLRSAIGRRFAQRLWRLSFMALLVASTLSACGYHFRGQVKLETQYVPVAVDDTGVNAEIKPRLIRSLKESSIPVAETAKARLHIIVSDVAFDKHLVSAAEKGAGIDTFDIGIRLRYKFSVEGKDLMPWQELRLNRTLQFSKSAVVSSATEESTLRDDLLNDAVIQIVTRLRYLDEMEKEARENESKG